MQNNTLKRIIFLLQISFFTLLLGAAIGLSVTNQNTNAESANKTAVVTKKIPTQTIQPAPWYGAVSTGVYTDNPSPISYENELGHKVEILAWFVHWDEKIDNAKLAYACSHGYVPQITWESRKGDEIKDSSYTLDDIVAGTYDSFIQSELESVKKTCKDQPIIIRFDHEMDTEPGRVGWYPWQGDPSKYIGAWDRVVKIGHTVSPTIKWLWSPNRGIKTTSMYYPGDASVDYVGITINRNPKQSNYTSFDVFYGHNQQVVESFNKPIIISETTYDEAGGTPTSKAAWIASMATYIKTNPKIVAVSWFQSRKGQSFESSPQSIAALKDAYAQLRVK